MSQRATYRPPRGWVGDVIPVERDGEFWLYYLHDDRRQPGEHGMGWSLVKTRDFVHFEDCGAALPAGGREDDDFNAYTGSVVEVDGVAHLYYTGQNPLRTGPDGRTPLQLVMHATSTDGQRTWLKDPEGTFGAPDGYEPGDWRDPFVFRAAADEPWRMLITARHDHGPDRRRGVIAQYTSDDLMTWKPAEPFWDPQRYIAHECPDVFQWGSWWYLVYSEFSEKFTTRYRVATSPDGPWRAPTHDSVDGRAFYAAKTVGRDGRRFFVGWIATRDGDSDDGAWQWAGDLSVLEAHQEPDGSLSFGLPASLQDSFDSVQPLLFEGGDDETADHGSSPVRLAAPDGYRTRITPGDVGTRFLARISVDVDHETTEVGVLLRSSSDGDESYCVRLEPRRSRMVFDRWPRKSIGPMQWEVSGDVPYLVELERPCVIEPGVHQIDLLVEDSILIAVLDQQTVLSARMYDRTTGHLGLFVGEGTATFFDMSLATRT